MHDQAKELRQLVCQGIVTAPADRAACPRLVVVSGAKGGVGATTIALNLAVLLARQGCRTAMVDADPHGGDAALLCGLEDRYTLADVLRGRRTVRQALQPGPDGIRVLPGVWGVEDISESSIAAQEYFIEQLQTLGDQTDCIVLDTGNGLNRLVRRLWLAAGDVLLITTPELASVMAAYASIKVLAAGDSRIPIRSLVTTTTDAAVAEDVHARLARACRRFLGIHLGSAGHVPREPLLAQPGKACDPLVIAAPGCPAVGELERIARTLATAAETAGRDRRSGCIVQA